MKRLFSPRMVKIAGEWRNEKCAEIQMRIKLTERLLYADRTELARLRTLSDNELVARFGWEDPNEVKRLMHERTSWFEELGQLWIYHNTKLGRNEPWDTLPKSNELKPVKATRS